MEHIRSCLKQAKEEARKERSGVWLAWIGLRGFREITKAVLDTSVKVPIDN